jgi:hypothetical protein
MSYMDHGLFFDRLIKKRISHWSVGSADILVKSALSAILSLSKACRRERSESPSVYEHPVTRYFQ